VPVPYGISYGSTCRVFWTLLDQLEFKLNNLKGELLEGTQAGGGADAGIIIIVWLPFVFLNAPPSSNHHSWEW
jgi:hypothetical protein